MELSGTVHHIPNDRALEWFLSAPRLYGIRNESSSQSVVYQNKYEVGGGDAPFMFIPAAAAEPADITLTCRFKTNTLFRDFE